MSFDVNNEAIVAAIINMAKSLGLDAVAKGVETEAQATRLLVLGCQVAQGFLFGVPTSAALLHLPALEASDLATEFASAAAVTSTKGK
jgi:EAL domain-containing protein (putative c-di-GMP-specific phosphodiesterase class I)